MLAVAALAVLANRPYLGVAAFIWATGLMLLCVVWAVGELKRVTTTVNVSIPEPGAAVSVPAQEV